jgi:hypothetical protein
MTDPTKLYAVVRDCNARLQWRAVGSATPIKGGGTQLHFEMAPTSAWGWKAYLFPAGAELPELPSDQTQQQPPPTDEI